MGERERAVNAVYGALGALDGYVDAGGDNPAALDARRLLREAVKSAPARPAPEGGGLPEDVRERLTEQADLLERFTPAAAIQVRLSSHPGSSLALHIQAADIRAALAAAASPGEPGEPTYTEREMADEVENRDRAEEWADRLAYAVAPFEVIGEHSSANSPWVNALAILQERAAPAGPGGGLDREAAVAAAEAALLPHVRLLILSGSATLGQVNRHAEPIAHDLAVYAVGAALAPLLTGGGAASRDALRERVRDVLTDVAAKAPEAERSPDAHRDLIESATDDVIAALTGGGAGA